MKKRIVLLVAVFFTFFICSVYAKKADASLGDMSDERVMQEDAGGSGASTTPPTTPPPSTPSTTPSPTNPTMPPKTNPTTPPQSTSKIPSNDKPVSKETKPQGKQPQGDKTQRDESKGSQEKGKQPSTPKTETVKPKQKQFEGKNRGNVNGNVDDGGHLSQSDLEDERSDESKGKNAGTSSEKNGKKVGKNEETEKKKMPREMENQPESIPMIKMIHRGVIGLSFFATFLFIFTILLFVKLAGMKRVIKDIQRMNQKMLKALETCEK